MACITVASHHVCSSAAAATFHLQQLAMRAASCCHPASTCRCRPAAPAIDTLQGGPAGPPLAALLCLLPAAQADSRAPANGPAHSLSATSAPTTGNSRLSQCSSALLLPPARNPQHWQQPSLLAALRSDHPASLLLARGHDATRTCLPQRHCSARLHSVATRIQRNVLQHMVQRRTRHVSAAQHCQRRTAVPLTRPP